ncbi:MAG TPA: hypothetical protein VKB80_35120, partial [Kofleriaceae bacterium]|nr:hypothetical protein [Kofleriaceae bacterium]
TAATLVAAVAAEIGALALVATTLGTDAGLIAGTFGIMLAPVVAPALIVVALHRLPPGRTRIGGRIAVRRIGGRGETLWLSICDDGLLLVDAGGVEDRIAGTELERIVADGECLRLGARGDGADRLFQVIEFDDPARRRRAAAALAAALTGRVTPARVISS